VTAYLRTFGKTAENLAYCRKLVDDFEPGVLSFGLGSMPEIFDGDAPHHPRGCIAQAWSVAELVRLLRSDLA
jgi:glycogen debranching enzyme